MVYQKSHAYTHTHTTRWMNTPFSSHFHSCQSSLLSSSAATSIHLLSIHLRCVEVYQIYKQTNKKKVRFRRTARRELFPQRAVSVM